MSVGSQSPPLLELDGVSKTFQDGVRGTVSAVTDVTLAVPSGNVCLLTGPSGSGKSTLLALAAGVLLPSRGEVRFKGEPFSRLRERFRSELRREHLGVVLQTLGLIAGMSVLENVTLPFVPDGGPTRVHLSRARELLASLGILELATSRVEMLSGGERQRVALARALMRQSAAALLLDEPTASLDQAACTHVCDLISQRIEQGGTALLVTHDPRVMEYFAPRTSVFRTEFSAGRLATSRMDS